MMTHNTDLSGADDQEVDYARDIADDDLTIDEAWEALERHKAKG